jgi:hypothetical protein
MMPQFFETDFTVSAWVPDRGQIEESNGLPIHRQNRTILLDERQAEIYRDFRPCSLEELVVTVTVSPALKYAWLAEETWTRKLTGKDADHKKDAAGRHLSEVDIESSSDSEHESSDREVFPGRPSSSEHSNSDGEVS